MEMAAIPPEGEAEITPMPEENPNDPFNLDTPEKAIDPENDLQGLSDDDLQQELELAIQKEDYERAGLIRDEMDRRKSD